MYVLYVGTRTHVQLYAPLCSQTFYFILLFHSGIVSFIKILAEINVAITLRKYKIVKLTAAISLLHTVRV